MRAMKRTSKAGTIAGLTAALIMMVMAMAVPGWAQRGAAGRAPMSAVRIAPAVRLAPLASGRVGTSLNPNFAPINGVPGLGFDFQHLAAVRPLVRDRFGREHRQFTPIIFAGLPYYASFDTGAPYYYSGDSQQEDSAQPYAAPLYPVGGLSPAEQPAVATQPASPVQELAPLVLVRRDGQVLFVVAFAVSGDRLTYITSEGTRRSFPVAELDKDSTRQMNDVNGTTVSLPD
jgi:hypothetical protein